MNKHFYLLRLFPVGNFQGANQCINEVSKPNEQEAIKLFQNLYPALNLNNNGYAKHGNETYCIAVKAF